VNHVLIAIAVGIVAIPAELAAIVASTVLHSVMNRADFRRGVFEGSVDCHASRADSMATLAHKIFAPGRIAEVLEPERIGRCLVGNSIVVAVQTGVGDGEIRRPIAGRVVARCRRPAVAGRAPFAGVCDFRGYAVVVEWFRSRSKVIDINRTEMAALAGQGGPPPCCRVIAVAGDVCTATAGGERGERGGVIEGQP